MPDTTRASDLWQQAIRAHSPETNVLTALRITHPDISTPVRVINDTLPRTIDGEDYLALRFGARLNDDVEGRVPRAELVLDNVGAALTQWVDASGGGSGATITIMSVSVPVEDVVTVEWSLIFDIVGMTTNHDRVVARLGFDPVLHRPAVQQRHDPTHSPGLF